MKVLSINVGSLREMLRNGKKIQTGIFKESIEGQIEVKRLGLEGDQQANNKQCMTGHLACYMSYL